jgi:DNA-binding transcriptional ArsR family regulator
MDVFAALADPVRRDLLRQLAAGPRRVADLASEHAISRPAISRHLRLLGEADLVTAEDRGRERHYQLHTGPLGVVADLLDELTTRRAPVTDRHLDALGTEVHRAGRDRRRAGARTPHHTTTTDEEIA